MSTIVQKTYTCRCGKKAIIAGTTRTCGCGRIATFEQVPHGWPKVTIQDKVKK